MSGRSSFAMPTNVYPKNGQVIVFNEDNRATMTFINNTDSLTFFRYNFYNIDTMKRSYYIMSWYYSKDDPLVPFDRGASIAEPVDRIKFDFPEQTDGSEVYNFEYGGHYSYDIIQYSAFPRDVEGETIYEPNINIKFASGKLQEVSSDTQITIATDLDITPPMYYGQVGEEGGEPVYDFTVYPETNTYTVSCTYICIYGKKVMITGYNPLTGEATLQTAITPIWLNGNTKYDSLTAGMPYSLYRNYFSSSGGSSEGTYDFYVRQKIQSASNADPVPGAFRCLAKYVHPDNIGLEKYRFKVYQIIDDDDNPNNNYITGTIQSWTDPETGINIGCDFKHVPIEKNLDVNLKNKRIIIGSESQKVIDQQGNVEPITYGDWGEIVSYDKKTGLVTLKGELESCPAEGQPYTIDLNSRVLIADSGDCYSWRLAYNFPLYLMGENIQLETILTSYEKQVSDTCVNISFPEPQLDYDYGQVNNEYSIVANNTNQTVELTFKDDIKNDDRFFGLYRKTKEMMIDDVSVDKWDYIGFIRGGNTFTDYLAANNTTYDYLIAKTVKYVDPYPEVIPPDFDPLHEFDYDPSVEYKAYAFENAVSTKWDGWSITAIYPCENDYISDPIQAIKTDNGHFIIWDGELKATTAQFVCSKTPYKVGDTWTFLASNDSGEIVSNLNRNVHVGTSTYPTVSGTNNKFESGTFSTDLVTIECTTDKIYDNIEKVKKWTRFITDDCLFILKSDKGDVWIVAISDNPSRSYDESVDDIITKVSYSWTEVDSSDNIQIVEY